jgi:excisionase family DNA binding protein
VSLDLPEYLTVRDLAAMLRVSSRTVERWVKDEPTMPVLRIAGTLRFPRPRLERWLLAREQGHPFRKQMRSTSNSAPAQEGQLS